MISNLKNNLILTVCTDYDFDDIQFFFESYKRHVNDCDLAIIGGRVTQSLKDTVKTKSSVFIDISDEYQPINQRHRFLLIKLKRTKGLRKYYPRFFKLLATKSSQPESYEYELNGLVAYRHKHYLDFVKKYDNYKNVAIVDIRDVIFQCNLFDVSCNAVEFGMEENIAVTLNSFNHRWLTTVAGQTKADTWLGRQVSCAGATFAPLALMQDYLSTMHGLLRNIREPLGPVDQGAHNCIQFDDLIQTIDRVPNRTRRVQNMQGQSDWIIKNHLLRNVDGSVTPVIHQWDRHSELIPWAESISFEQPL